MFIITMYQFVISKTIMPYTGNKILDWIKDDDYYCCLLPCTFLMFYIFSYFNWTSLKYFRHN